MSLNRRTVRVLTAVTGVLAVPVFLALVIGALAGTPRVEEWAAELPAVLVPTPGNSVMAVAAILLLAACLSLRHWQARRPGHRDVTGVVIVAAVAGVLGIASFLPCTADESVLSAVANVLSLFDIENDAELLTIGPVCFGAPPLAYQVARVLAIATAFLAVFTVVLALLKNRITAWSLRFWHHLDVVVGTDEVCLPLVEALIADNAREAAEDGNGSPPPQRRVLVVQSSDTSLAAAETLGAALLVDDPDNVVRSLCARRKIPINRLFALYPDETQNARLVDLAQQTISAASTNRSWLAQQTIPRLIARFDDSRKAKDWQLAHADTQGCFVDAVTSDALLARDFVRIIAEQGHTRVIIAGDSALGIELLDELALQRCFEAEILAAWDAAAQDAAPNDLRPRPAERLTRLSEVVVVDERADDILSEWNNWRAPAAAFPQPLPVRADRGTWEQVIAKADDESELTAVVIVTDASSEVSSRAGRLSRLHPSMLIFAPSTIAHGIAWEPRRLGSAYPVDYGPTLTIDGRPPEDSWTVLARQNHEVYVAGARADDLRPSRRPWAPKTAPALPHFYKEDNLRFICRLLAFMEADEGYRWVRATDARTPRADLPGDTLLRAARTEHERWCDMRLAHRWVYGPAADDAGRKSPNLVDWDTGLPLGAHRDTDPADTDALHRRNMEAIARTLERLRLWGLVPLGRYVRTGEVTAERLDAPLTWTTQAGDLLTGETGDWKVVDDAGVRTVKPLAFTRLYEPLGEDRYRRTGEVCAMHADHDATIVSLEGKQQVKAGEWIVMDDTGNVWGVPDDVFRSRYKLTKFAPTESRQP